MSNTEIYGKYIQYGKKYPGATGTIFKIKLEADWFRKGDKIVIEDIYYCKVTSTPTSHYSKWYWRLLNFLTFKLWFNIEHKYTLEYLH